MSRYQSPYNAAVDAINGSDIKHRTTGDLKLQRKQLQKELENTTKKLDTPFENSATLWYIAYYNHLIGFINGELIERTKAKKHPSVSDQQKTFPPAKPSATSKSLFD